MKSSKYRFSSVLFFIGSAILCTVSANAATPPIRVVAFQNQQAPGAATGTVFTDFSEPVINNSGETAFRATITPQGSAATLFGYWFEGANHVNMAAIQGGQPSVDFSNPVFAYTDQAKFVFPTPTGIWLATPAGLSLVTSQNTLPNRPTINKNGVVAFTRLDDVWTWTNGVLSHEIAQGFYPPNSSNYFCCGGTPKINTAGRISITNGISHWTNNRGTFEQIAYNGMQAPGFEAGVTFRLYSSFVMTNGRGDVYFPDSVSADGSNYYYTLWRFRDGQLRMIARDGGQAPGLPAGVEFSTIPEVLVTGDAGDAAFSVDLRGPGIDPETRHSIWRLHDDTLQLVAQSRMPVPTVSASVLMALDGPPVMNDQGHIAFHANLINVDPHTSSAILGEDASGILRVAIRAGDIIDVDPGPGTDLRTINTLSLLSATQFSNFNFQRGQNDQPFAFNDVGQIAFKATFVGGGVGIFVSDALTVPEPATIVFAVFLAFTLAQQRTRRVS